jgi:hypothetical protein
VQSRAALSVGLIYPVTFDGSKLLMSVEEGEDEGEEGKIVII